MRIFFVLLLYFFSALVSASENQTCIDGLWLFDDDASETLFSTIEKINEAEKDSKNINLRMFPNFVFTTTDLNIKRLEHSVLLEQKDLSGQNFQRRFSTSGKTQSVSLKTAHQSGNTVVASWEDNRLIIETTGVTGLYTEETFSLKKNIDEAPILHVKGKVLDPSGINFSFEKFYTQSKPDWLACTKVSKPVPN